MMIMEQTMYKSGEREKKKRKLYTRDNFWFVYDWWSKQEKKKWNPSIFTNFVFKMSECRKNELTNDKNCLKFVKNLDYRKHLDESHD